MIDNNKDNPQIQQTSLAELHKLNITLSNYFDVAPGITLSKTSEIKSNKAENSTTESEAYPGLTLRISLFGSVINKYILIALETNQ